MSETNFLLEALQEFEQRVVQAAKDNLQRTNKNVSGKLDDSIKGEVKQMPNSIRVFFQMDNYGWFQDQGVRGVKSGKSLSNFSYKSKGGKRGLKGMPPPSAFDKWTIRKPIKGIRDKKTGKFLKRKTINFLIARSVFHHGIKASMFFTKPFNSAFEKLPNELIDKYGLDMENLLVSIIEENLKTK
tara:strand:+ start:1706 stop:2260 length:555 start_codon:yes stop_codon:yes gene_type:complete